MFPVSQIFGCRLTISTFSVLFFAFSKTDSPNRSLVLAQRGVLITLVEDVAILELRVERLDRNDYAAGGTTLRQSWRGRAVRGTDGGKRLAEEEFGRWNAQRDMKRAAGSPPCATVYHGMK